MNGPYDFHSQEIDDAENEVGFSNYEWVKLKERLSASNSLLQSGRVEEYH